MEQCVIMTEPLQMTDSLIEACRQGDREAFRQLFELHQHRVYSIALYFFNGDKASAEDVAQQVFLQLFTKLEQFRYEAEFSTWLYRIVANSCIDEQRRRRRFTFFGDATELEKMPERTTQADRYERQELQAMVQAVLAKMKPEFRLPLLLKYVEGLSYDEIARALECSVGTVASRLNRGHKILAQKLAHLRGALAGGE